MLRVHFLNVGHGDCTVIKDPSGRLTMIDINNSQAFDAATYAEELEEERQKHIGALAGLLGSGGQGVVTPSPFGGLGGTLGLGQGVAASSPFAGLGGSLGLGGAGILSDYLAVADRAKRELTDPIEFLKKTYPQETIWRLVITHPDLDHCAALEHSTRECRVHELLGHQPY